MQSLKKLDGKSAGAKKRQIKKSFLLHIRHNHRASLPPPSPAPSSSIHRHRPFSSSPPLRVAIVALIFRHGQRAEQPPRGIQRPRGPSAAGQGDHVALGGAAAGAGLASARRWKRRRRGAEPERLSAPCAADQVPHVLPPFGHARLEPVLLPVWPASPAPRRHPAPSRPMPAVRHGPGSAPWGFRFRVSLWVAFEPSPADYECGGFHEQLRWPAWGTAIRAWS